MCRRRRHAERSWKCQTITATAFSASRVRRSGRASPGQLWPPNHELIPIAVTDEVDGGLSGGAGFTLASVSSNEPDDAEGGGDGDTVDDIQGFDVGGNDTAGLLRAERAGSGTGRVYTLTYTARDSALNERTCTTTVTVPHDKK